MQIGRMLNFWLFCLWSHRNLPEILMKKKDVAKLNYRKPEVVLWSKFFKKFVSHTGWKTNFLWKFSEEFKLLGALKICPRTLWKSSPTAQQK